MKKKITKPEQKNIEKLLNTKFQQWKATYPLDTYSDVQLFNFIKICITERLVGENEQIERNLVWMKIKDILLMLNDHMQVNKTNEPIFNLIKNLATDVADLLMDFDTYFNFDDLDFRDHIALDYSLSEMINTKAEPVTIDPTVTVEPEVKQESLEDKILKWEASFNPGQFTNKDLFSLVKDYIKNELSTATDLETKNLIWLKIKTIVGIFKARVKKDNITTYPISYRLVELNKLMDLIHSQTILSKEDDEFLTKIYFYGLFDLAGAAVTDIRQLAVGTRLWETAVKLQDDSNAELLEKVKHTILADGGISTKDKVTRMVRWLRVNSILLVLHDRHVKDKLAEDTISTIIEIKNILESIPVIFIEDVIFTKQIGFLIPLEEEVPMQEDKVNNTFANDTFNDWVMQGAHTAKSNVALMEQIKEYLDILDGPNGVKTQITRDIIWRKINFLASILYRRARSENSVEATKNFNIIRNRTDFFDSYTSEDRDFLSKIGFFNMFYGPDPAEAATTTTKNNALFDIIKADNFYTNYTQNTPWMYVDQNPYYYQMQLPSAKPASAKPAPVAINKKVSFNPQRMEAWLELFYPLFISAATAWNRPEVCGRENIYLTTKNQDVIEYCEQILKQQSNLLQTAFGGCDNCVLKCKPIRNEKVKGISCLHSCFGFDTKHGLPSDIMSASSLFGLPVAVFQTALNLYPSPAIELFRYITSNAMQNKNTFNGLKITNNFQYSPKELEMGASALETIFEEIASKLKSGNFSNLCLYTRQFNEIIAKSIEGDRMHTTAEALAIEADKIYNKYNTIKEQNNEQPKLKLFIKTNIVYVD